MSILIAFILSACASDLPINSTGPAAVALVMTPAADSVDIAEALQFEARVLWSDGKEHGANVTYSATGGDITVAGLYRAGRSPGEYWVVASCGCGVVDSSAVTILPPRATGLVVLPSTAALDTAATLQFQSAVTWSDSANHPVLVTWSATGGTISDSGLYRAGTTVGQFHVVATCACGLVDTTIVAITTSTNNVPPPLFASLLLGISGLPVDVLAQVTVTGPEGFRRNVTASAAFDSLNPGDYAVDAAGVSAGANSYSPTPPSQTVKLKTGSPQVLQVDYRLTASGGLPPHPRVWMTPERVARLQAQAAAGTVRWSRVKSGADAQLAKGTAYSGGDQNLLPDLCLAYLGTGDVRYAQRAGVVLTGYAVEANALLVPTTGYNYRWFLPLVTMGLDWCYDGLTTAQRQQTATWLMNRADWAWPETNPSRIGAWGVWPSDNFYWGFMMTGPAALAAAGDDTGTGTVSGADRPAYHRQLALAKWNSEALPFFQTEGEGGAWDQGTTYDSSWRLGAFADAYLTAGMPVSTPFFEASLRWRMHSTMPGGVYKAPLGDQPREAASPLYAYDRLAALYNLAPARADATLSAQIHAWLNWIGQVPTSENGETAKLADELLRFDPSQAVAADLSALPKDFYAPGAGFFVYRQSWTDPNATVMVFESGPITNHSAKDANGLMIWKGSFWISANANIYSGTGITQATQYFNNLTVGGVGQAANTGNRGFISAAPQVSDQLVVVRGQAKLGYGNQTPWVNTRSVSDYLRTVAYLPQQDVFVIVDRATVLNPALPKVWRWHMKDVPQVSGNTFRLQSPSADFRCFGSVLAPANAVVGSESISIGRNPGVSSNAVTVSMSGNASDVVVTVLQCTGAQSAPFTPTADVSASEVVVTIAGLRVVVPLNESQSVRIE